MTLGSISLGFRAIVLTKDSSKTHRFELRSSDRQTDGRKDIGFV